MEARIGIKKSVWENEKRYEGYAIVDGIQKELTPELLEELKNAIKTGKMKTKPATFWLNDKGNPLQSA